MKRLGKVDVAVVGLLRLELALVIFMASCPMY